MIEVSSHISYAACHKLKLVLLAKESGNHAAGIQFNFVEKCVRGWIGLE